MKEFTSELKFSLNRASGWHGQIEILGERVWFVAARKTNKSGNSWIQINSDCGRYQFKLNDSTFAS
mgnify:CR=1 FL=1